MKNAHRAGKIVKLTTFKTVKRGNWLLRFSCTDMNSIMLLAVSVLAPENMFLKYFTKEDDATSFTDFLVLHDFWSPEIEE
jgi:hypothetical protein